MRLPAAALLLATLGLSAQENPGGNRMGIGLSALVPLATWGSSFDTGFQVGLQVHFNRESRHLGRLRIDYLQADTKRPIQTGIWDVWNGSAWVPTPQWATGRMEAYSVAYEWLPHLENHSRSGPFGILGLGGTLWNETAGPRTPRLAAPTRIPTWASPSAPGPAGVSIPMPPSRCATSTAI